MLDKGGGLVYIERCEGKCSLKGGKTFSLFFLSKQRILRGIWKRNEKTEFGKI